MKHGALCSNCFYLESPSICNYFSVDYEFYINSDKAVSLIWNCGKEGLST